MNKQRVDNKMAATARTYVFTVAAVVLLLFVSCDKLEDKCGSLYSSGDSTVYPDSFVSPKLALAAIGDSMLIRDFRGDRYDRIVSGCRNNVVMEGGDGLFSYLFNQEPGDLGRDYDEFTPYEIYISDGLLNAEHSASVVDSRIVSGQVVDYRAGVYRWPVAMSDATWGLAASTVSLMLDDGENVRGRAAALKKMIDRDIAYVYDGGEGLFSGVPAEMDMKQLPQWADAADAAVMLTLGGNVSRLAGMRYVNEVLADSYSEELVESLFDNISKRFWIPDAGMLSQALYQRPSPIAVSAADNLAQALAVVTGGVSEPMAERILSSMPICNGAVPVTYPNQSVGDNRRRDIVTTAMWGIASSRVGNGAVWGECYGRLAMLSTVDAFALRMFKGVTLRTIFGVNPCADGLRIEPYVHAELGEYHRVRGLRYRNGELTITVRGRGNVISTFSIDGVVMPESVVPLDIVGEHEVEVVLSGEDTVRDVVRRGELTDMLNSPEVTVDNERQLSIYGAERGRLKVYVNGAVSEVIGGADYELYNAKSVTAVCFEPKTSMSTSGYASKSYLYIPSRDSVSIPSKSVAQTGGRVLAKKDIAAKHVESTRFKNSRIVFKYEEAVGGDYYVRLRYLDGLGVVNKNRQYALRLLNVNGERAGIMVLSQRGPEEWSVAEDWATMIGTTEPIAVELKSGLNEIEIEYFMPGGVSDADHDGNIAIPLALELIRR